MQRSWGRNMPRLFEEKQGSRSGAIKGQMGGDEVREERGGGLDHVKPHRS